MSNPMAGFTIYPQFNLTMAHLKQVLLAVAYLHARQARAGRGLS